MNVQIEESWKTHLQPEFDKDYFRTLTEFVKSEYYKVYSNFLASEKLKNVLEKYIDEVNLNDDKDAWFSRIKSICEPCGCTPNVKEYKQNPDNFKGHVGDVSTIIRVALTGRTNTPDLFSITALLGEKRVKERLTKALEYYKENK